MAILWKYTCTQNSNVISECIDCYKQSVMCQHTHQTIDSLLTAHNGKILLSTPVRMHGGLICIAFCMSGWMDVWMYVTSV